MLVLPNHHRQGVPSPKFQGNAVSGRSMAHKNKPGMIRHHLHNSVRIAVVHLHRKVGLTQGGLLLPCRIPLDQGTSRISPHNLAAATSFMCLDRGESQYRK